MTAKKMADIFFGKFSELIVPQSNTSEDKEIEISIKDNDKITEKSFKKILTYTSSIIILLIIAYYFLA
jgi:hypothetical protein